VRDWQPTPELYDDTRAAMTALLGNAMIAGAERIAPVRALLLRLSREPDGDGRLAGWAKVMSAFDPADPGGFLGLFEALADDADRHTALPALQWLSFARENVGDLPGATEAAERALALVGHDDGPWQAAMLHNQLAQLRMQLGDRAAASGHARAALPVMRRLGATDDEVQLRAMLGLCALAEGRLEEAELELEGGETLDESEAIFGGAAIRQIGRAELALARGDTVAGLRIYRKCAAQMRELGFPGIPRTGLEPWAIFGDSTALAAHAYLAANGDETHGEELFGRCRAHAASFFDPENAHLDYPVAGMLLFGLGAWGLLRRAMSVEDAVRLLMLADRFAYNQMIPTLAWGRIAPRIEEAAPGQIAELRAQYRDHRPPDLLQEARRAVERVEGSDVGG
jgi:hypothetical protein